VNPDGLWISIIAKKLENTVKNAKKHQPTAKPNEY